MMPIKTVAVVGDQHPVKAFLPHAVDDVVQIVAGGR